MPDYTPEAPDNFEKPSLEKANDIEHILFDIFTLGDFLLTVNDEIFATADGKAFLYDTDAMKVFQSEHTGDAIDLAIRKLKEIENATAEAQRLSSTEQPTATAEFRDGSWNLSFGIPAGEAGEQGERGLTGKRGPRGEFTNFRGNVNAHSDLLGVSAIRNDAFFNLDDNLLYIFGDDGFPSEGKGIAVSITGGMTLKKFQEGLDFTQSSGTKTELVSVPEIECRSMLSFPSFMMAISQGNSQSIEVNRIPATEPVSTDFGGVNYLKRDSLRINGDLSSWDWQTQTGGSVGFEQFANSITIAQSVEDVAAIDAVFEIETPSGSVINVYLNRAHIT
jgi:hypothetical protein